MIENSGPTEIRVDISETRRSGGFQPVSLAISRKGLVDI